MTTPVEMTAPKTRPAQSAVRVVVVGAGFAGLAAAKALAGRNGQPSRVEVTLVDQNNYHVFTPLLYQVATALLEPTGAARPVRPLIRGLRDVKFRLAQVNEFNFRLHRVESDHGSIDYDYLIVATGAVNDDFQSADFATKTFSLNHLDAAQELRSHILSCFEAAVWVTDSVESSRLLTFAVVGGGPTGVEFSAALSVLVHEMVARDFAVISGSEPRVVLIEGSTAVLTSFAPDLQDKAMQALQARGVRIESAALAAEVDKDGLVLKDGRRIESATVVWAAGVRANPLADCFPATGSRGRVIVGPTLQVERHPEVFVVGDCAEIPGRSGALPMLAQVAIQSGRHAARSVLALSSGGTVSTFHYRDLGTMAVLGRGDAVAQIGRVHLSGLSGWLAWLAVHLARANSWQTKATVMLDWVSGLVFTDRPVRLITRPTVQATSSETGARPPDARAEPVGAVAFAKADLPSVNVANTHRWGRVAALAWWSQDYPGLRPKPTRQKGIAALRGRALRLRHVLTGDKSSADD